MTNPILYYKNTMASDNELITMLEVIEHLESEGISGGINIWSNDAEYTANQIVYYNGYFYKALTNINPEDGSPIAIANWEKMKPFEYSTTATAGGTTTLTGISKEIQFFTGSTTQNCDMPVVSTLSLGRQWFIRNKSSGIVTVRSSGGNTIIAIPSNGYAIITCIAITGTSETSWDYILNGGENGTNLTLSGVLNESKGSNIASASTTDIGAATGNTVTVTGTTTITALGTAQAGARRTVIFSDALILTHNATSLILPGGANITTVAGDVATFISLGSGNWICVSYEPATVTGSGATVKATSPALTTPNIGVATAASVNKVSFTTPASSATLTIDDGKTLRSKKTLTFDGTDGTEHTLPSSNSVLARTDTGQSFTGSHEFLNGLLVGEEGGLTLKQTLSADGKRSSCMSKIFVLGETCAFGDLVYYKSADSRWWKTDSDTESTSGNVMIGFVCVAGNAGDTTNILLQGIIRADSKFPTLTVGAPVYIGSTAGEVQVSKPTSGIVRLIGYAETADSIVFKPSDDYYELGTFNLSVSFGGGTTGITYAYRSGFYKKVDNKVEVFGYIGLSNKGSSTGQAKLTNLPYSCSSESLSFTPACVAGLDKIEIGDQLNVRTDVGTSTMLMHKCSTGGFGTALTNSDFQNDSGISISCNYLV